MANFNKIEKGMKEAQVTDLLGKPLDRTPNFGTFVLSWRDGSTGTSIIVIVKDDKVTERTLIYREGGKVVTKEGW